MSRSCVLGLCVGVFAAALSLVPAILELEEDVGLGALFALRGAVAAPDRVAVVSIARESADTFGLRSDPDEWPRSLHAELVERLSAAGAAAIVFDIIFDRERRPEDDRRFAEAIGAARNVILLERVETDVIATGGAGAVVDRRIPPIPILKSKALASAPFTLPVVPIKTSQFWAFGRPAGDNPSLPVVALQAYALPVYDELVGALRDLRPEAAANVPRSSGELVEGRELEKAVRSLRGLFRRDRDLAGEVLERLGRGSLPREGLMSLHALIDACAGEDSRYLNYYGPPGTIRTIPYHAILDDSRLSPDLQGRIVFVGFSERRQPEQQDDFYSVFSERSGLSLSGVEVAATAFGNLLQRSFVLPLGIPAHLLVVFLWGVGLGFLLLLPASAALATAAAAGVAYSGAAFLSFRNTGLWLPVVVPLGIEVPGALFAALLWNYEEVRRQRERILTALGYYVPSEVADKLAHDSTRFGARKKLLFGTCLFTDAEQYTAVSEAMRPEALQELMNDYYRVMFKVVERYGGLISDTSGDSMVAIWAAADRDATWQARASTAALEILARVAEFNRGLDRHVLPTRIGLASGELLLGDIGAERHFEYRAVGDIVNTASRIQGLNKLLGTHILVSEATLAHPSGLATRCVGAFVLRGKKSPVVIHELTGGDDESGERRRRRDELFSAALESFRRGEWIAAEGAFARALDGDPDDGPSRFYAGLCERYRENPPSDWDGAVRLTMK